MLEDSLVGVSVDPFSFETDDAAEWASVIGRSLLPLAMTALRPGEFHAGIHGRARSGIRLATVRTMAHSARRGGRVVTPTPAKDASSGAMVLCCALEGQGTIFQNGREAQVEPGRFVFYDSELPVDIVVTGKLDMFNLVVPHSQLSVARTHRHDLIANALRADSGLAPALLDLVTNVDSVIDRLDADVQRRTLQQVAGLMDTLLQLETAGSSDLPARGSRRFTQLTTYIDEHLDDADLVPESIAAANFMSVRTLHASFAEAGESVATWMRARRLERCAGDLRDPFLAHIPVGAICARRGFRNQSSFAQQFRGWSGLSPSEYRRSHLAG